MKLGERVNVDTENFKGMATILYIFPGEIYPVQVGMDQGDADGHRIHRIMSREIVHGSRKETAGISFEGPDDPQRYIGEVVQEHEGYAYRKGQQFILGVVKYPGTFKAGPATSFYVYELESLAFSGCMPADMFIVLGPYEAGQIVRKAPESVPAEPKVEEKAIERRNAALKKTPEYRS